MKTSRTAMMLDGLKLDDLKLDDLKLDDLKLDDLDTDDLKPDDLKTDGSVRTPSHRSLMSASRSMAEPVECPKCGKRSIVKRSQNLFDCLNCNFHKELPPIAGAYSRRQQSGGVSPALDRLAQSRLNQTPYGGGASNLIVSNDPRRFQVSQLEEMPPSDKFQPLVFAAIAVIFGILLL
ncbi:MAG: hypothetical protein AAF171_09900 [Cyanobacteria bacterium P01_A01_bin.116]